MADDPSDFENNMREWIGETLGLFALNDPRVTEAQLIEAVDVELVMGAETAEEVLSPQNWRITCRPAAYSCLIGTGRATG
jgi:hypothetical protein